jgi:hypothetical protein
MPYIDKMVEVEVSLEDFGDKELLDEIALRVKRLESDKSTFFAIAALQALNCPDEILAPLLEWAKSPVANNEKLAKWIELAK